MLRALDLCPIRRRVKYIVSCFPSTIGDREIISYQFKVKWAPTWASKEPETVSQIKCESENATK